MALSFRYTVSIHQNLIRRQHLEIFHTYGAATSFVEVDHPQPSEDATASDPEDGITPRKYAQLDSYLKTKNPDIPSWRMLYCILFPSDDGKVPSNSELYASTVSTMTKI